MGEASNQRDFPNSVDSPIQKELQLTPPTHFNTSTLYDSFELQAVTRQLNKAMNGSTASSPTYFSYIKSPFYRQRLDRIYKENARSPKKIGLANSTTHDRKWSTRAATRGLVTRLWKKVIQGLLWNKQRN
ncbi:hypothetical protein JRO89_XS13G0258200 [Xanthoceras sorbifolium]|uniref:Uncharacterized protein n=1 Tax=Xanthoceras sorbifolium TaxID=99658 RepID=A0ABQ8H9Y4_9ROSI|nr:hypothetical protein JRO89_XS13G0258200 [Xanthoceras sorbifolium]